MNLALLSAPTIFEILVKGYNFPSTLTCVFISSKRGYSAILIVKDVYKRQHFEILVDPDLAAEFRNPDGQDVAIEDLLAVEEIFKDSKKGCLLYTSKKMEIIQNI